MAQWLRRASQEHEIYTVHDLDFMGCTVYFHLSNATSSEDINAYFESLPLETQLDNESQLTCDGPVTYEECAKALR